MNSFSWLGVITIASIEKDKQRLAELFASVARIPKPKMEKALKDNDIRDLIKNPGLLSPTIAELERIELLQEYRSSYHAKSFRNEIQNHNARRRGHLSGADPW
jgi:hypothetical protein